MTTEIVGWDPQESADMLAFLFEWTTKPEFVYSHAWQPGDALMWDNACTMHRRDPFDPTHARLMKRTTILPRRSWRCLSRSSAPQVNSAATNGGELHSTFVIFVCRFWWLAACGATLAGLLLSVRGA